MLEKKGEGYIMDLVSTLYYIKSINLLESIQDNIVSNMIYQHQQIVYGTDIINESAFTTNIFEKIRLIIEKIREFIRYIINKIKEFIYGKPKVIKDTDVKVPISKRAAAIIEHGDSILNKIQELLRILDDEMLPAAINNDGTKCSKLLLKYQTIRDKAYYELSGEKLSIPLELTVAELNQYRKKLLPRYKKELEKIDKYNQKLLKKILDIESSNKYKYKVIINTISDVPDDLLYIPDDSNQQLNKYINLLVSARKDIFHLLMKFNGNLLLLKRDANLGEVEKQFQQNLENIKKGRHDLNKH